MGKQLASLVLAAVAGVGAAYGLAVWQPWDHGDTTAVYCVHDDMSGTHYCASTPVRGIPDHVGK